MPNLIDSHKRLLAVLVAFLIAGFVSVFASAQDEGEAPAEEATTAPTEEAPADEPAADAAAGMEAYNAACARCHGEDGQAQTRVAERMGVPAFTAESLAAHEDLAAAITTGHGERNPAADLDEATLAAVVAYVHTLVQ